MYLGVDTELYKWIKGLVESNQEVKFYKSRHWKELRERVVKRDNYECQRCKGLGKVTTSKTLTRKGKPMKMEVHHKIPLKKDIRLALSESNLELLCIICHNIEDRKGFNKDRKEKFWVEERW